MHPEDIKAAIRKKGRTQKSVAAALGVSSMAVAHVVMGRQKSARVARAISALTGLRVSELFPGRYPQLEMLESAGLLHADATQAESELRTLAPKTTPSRAAKTALQAAPAAAAQSADATPTRDRRASDKPGRRATDKAVNGGQA